MPVVHPVLFLDRLTFPKQQEPVTAKRKAVEEEPSPPKKIIVHPHVIENRGPYPYNQPRKYEFDISRVHTYKEVHF